MPEERHFTLTAKEKIMLDWAMQALAENRTAQQKQLIELKDVLGAENYQKISADMRNEQVELQTMQAKIKALPTEEALAKR